MKTKLYPNKKVAKQVARTYKVCNPDFSYVVGSATAKPSPSMVRRGLFTPENADAFLEGYYCIRKHLGKDFHSFA